MKAADTSSLAPIYTTVPTPEDMKFDMKRLGVEPSTAPVEGQRHETDMKPADARSLALIHAMVPTLEDMKFDMKRTERLGPDELAEVEDAFHARDMFVQGRLHTGHGTPSTSASVI